jgi:4-hydroxybenzoyl-CoA reductase subunit beta
MLRLPPFRLHQPQTLAEAAAILAAEPDARLVAGGTDLWPNMKRRHQSAAHVVSLMKVPGLDAVVDEGDDGVRIGATARLADVAAHPAVVHRFPALAKAIEAISSPVLRQQGTLGGNLCLDTRCTYYNQSEEWRRSIDYCMKAAGQVCWVAPGSPRCWAVSSSDSAPMLCALEARVRLVSADGSQREIALEELYNDDGMQYLTKRRDEVLAEVIVPASSDDLHCGSGFQKLRRRGSIDFAVLSVAAALWTDGAGRVDRARVFLGAVASFPVAASDCEKALVGAIVDPEGLNRASSLARKDATPMDNTDYQAQWRGQILHSFTRRALAEAARLPAT